jgi:uncharacterized protein (TIGR00255 family)
MTGFGSASAENDNYTVSAEIRCINSKSLDASLRFPKNFSDKENEIRNLLTQALERGKVLLNVEVQTKGDVTPQASLNKTLLKSYYTLLSETAQELNTSSEDLFRLALQMPEVIQYSEDEEKNELLWSLLQKALSQAITGCNDFRKAEGKALEDKLTSYIQKIQNLLELVSKQDPARIENIRQKIANRMTEIAKDEKFDKNRFEQEMIYYIEKLDISEEKVRLGTHLNYFLEVVTKEENQGRKLNFISQEIGREINTIGSKANDAVIQRHVVEMKEELEKIKEQVLNLV